MSLRFNPITNNFDLVVDSAAEILLDTTNFTGTLGPSDDTVQKALDTLDDFLGAAVVWGDITGTLANQTDLKNALDTKMNTDGSNSFVDSFLFNTSLAKPAHQEGLLFYDKDEHAIVMYNDEAEVTHQLGQEHFIRVFNDSGNIILNGKVVYISGADLVENKPTIALAKADIRDTASVIGMTTHDIEDQTFGYITILGLVNNLDTSTYSSGDVLYLSTITAGEFTSQIPSEGEIVFKVGTVVKAHATEGSIYVKLSDRGALTEYSLISDVLGTTWKSGLVITEHSPTPDQSVDYTNGDYFISGILKEITPSGTLDLSSFYTTLANDEKAIVTIYVDLDSSLKTAIGSPVGNNQQPTAPILPLNTVCLAEVTISKDEFGALLDITDSYISDCRKTLSKNPAAPTDEYIRVSDTDIVSKHLEEALKNDGNVQFTLNNPGGDEYLSADVDLSGKSNVGHTHIESDITDLDKYTQSEVDNFFEGEDSGKKQIDWLRVINKPVTFPPGSHTHVEADITDLDKYTQLEVDNLLAAQDELSELDDTLITSPQDLDFLKYDGVAEKWINEPFNDSVFEALLKANAFSEGISSTTSTTYQEKLTLNYTPDFTGDYLVLWSAATASDSANKPIQIRVQVDDTTTINESTWGANFTNEYSNNTGMTVTTLTGGVTYKFDLDFRLTTTSGTPTGFIRRARIMLIRLI